jgi:hypothetical protein
VLIFRIDTFKDIIINIDEIQWLQQAELALKNPIPFVGFDSSTSGPFAIYIIAPLLKIVNSTSVVELRLYGLILVFVLTNYVLYNKSDIKISIISVILFSSFFLIINRDFFSYNTEWPSIPLILFLTLFYIDKKKFKSFNVLAISFIIFSLPLIKFQFIIFSAFFFLVYLIELRSSVYLALYLLSYLFYNTITIFIIYLTTGLENFYYYFFEKNFFYANNYNDLKGWGETGNLFIYSTFFQKLINNFYVYIALFLFYFLFICFNKKIIYTLKKSFFLISLFLITSATIFLPRTNFDHYYQLLFVPVFSIIYVAIIKNSLLRKITIIVIVFLFVPIISSVNNIIYNYLNNISTNTIIKNGEYWPEDQKVLKTIHVLIKKEENVLFIGAPHDLICYYRFKNNKNQFLSPFYFAHIEYFAKKSKTDNQIRIKLYRKERELFIKNLKTKPKFIFDFGDRITSLNDYKINKYLKKSYSKNNLIYLSKSPIFYYSLN